MTRRLLCCVGLLLMSPIAASAQTVNGEADWGYSRSTFRTGPDTTDDGSFTQSYRLGYASSFWDPRFALYSGELTFDKNALTFGSQASGTHQTGFNGAMSLFSQRPFRVALHGTRSTGAESANYPDAGLMRGGALPLPPGASPELQTGRSAFGASAVVSTPSAPRVEFSVEQGSSTEAAGPLAAVQQERSLHGLLSKEGVHASHTIRYEYHSAENDVSTAFQQKYSDLTYEFTANTSDRTHANVRAGRRTAVSRLTAPPDFSGDFYRPPVSGDIEAYYATATLTHQPNSRLTAEANVGYNDERSSVAGTGALLASTTARVQPFTGLTLRGSGTYGSRRQDFEGARIAVLTRAVGAGADYLVRLRAFHASAGYEAERGWNTNDLHVEGGSRAWRARVEGGVDLFGVFQLGAGRDRDRAVDQLLVLGNQWQDRTHASLRSVVAQRVFVDYAYEHAVLDRGLELQLFRTRYEQVTGTAMFQVTRERRAG